MQPHRPKSVNQHDSNRWLLLAVVMACLAGAFRVGVAVSDPLWLDELHTAWCCAAESQEIATDRAIRGNQTPLFFWLEYKTVQVAGLSEFSLRLLPLIAGISLVALAAAWTARSTHSLLAGTLTGLVATVEPGLIFYATEARPFGLLQFTGLLQFICFVQVWEFGTISGEAKTDPSESKSKPTSAPRQQAWRLGLLITTGLIPWLHLTGATLIVAQLLWCLIRIAKPGARLCLPMVLLGSLAAVPLIPMAWSVAGHHSDWSVVSDPVGLVREWGTLLVIWGLIPMAGLLLAKVLARRRPAIRWSGFGHPLTMLIWCILVPPMSVVIADQAFGIPVALSRYAQVSAGLLPVLAGMIVGLIGSDRRPGFAPTTNPSRSVEGQGGDGPAGSPVVVSAPSGTVAARTWIAVLVLLLTMGLSPMVDELLSRGTLPQLRHENWKFAVERLNQRAAPDQPLFLFSNLVEDHRVAQMSGRPLTVEDQEFLEYLRFPVRGIYRAVNEDVRPRSTLSGPRFWLKDPDPVVAASRGWMLVRGTPELVATICQDFRQAYVRSVAPEYKLEISSEQLSGSNVFLVELSVIRTNDSEIP